MIANVGVDINLPSDAVGFKMFIKATLILAHGLYILIPCMFLLPRALDDGRPTDLDNVPAGLYKIIFIQQVQDDLPHHFLLILRNHQQGSLLVTTNIDLTSYLEEYILLPYK